MDINHLDICNLAKIPVKMQDNPFRLLAINIAKGCDDFNDAKKLFLDSCLKQRAAHTLGILYDIPNSTIAHLPSSTIFLPWMHSKPVDHKKFNDVFISIFSDESYLKNHYNRIKKLVYSIKEYGYIPDKFPTRQGGICGYFLEGEGQSKFYVTAGNHRAAVLAALFGDYKIPIIIENKSHLKPRDTENRGDPQNTYSYKNIDSWPAVSSGFLSKKNALKILNTYL